VLPARIAATPRNKDIFTKGSFPRLAAKANYLIRDTNDGNGLLRRRPGSNRRLASWWT
jgi:hypothetical protein